MTQRATRDPQPGVDAVEHDGIDTSAGELEGLSIVVPVFNEERTLASSIDEILASATPLGVPLEIVVVDDGSIDRTAAIASQIAVADPRVRLVRHRTNRRLGAALRTGIAEARFPRVILDPVDCPLRSEEFRALYDGCGRAEIAVGYRPGRPGYPSWLRSASGVYHGMLRVALGVKLRDYNWCCGYRREIFATIPIRFDGIIALPEVLGRAHRAGMRLVEVPVDMRPRVVGTGTVRQVHKWMRIASDLLALTVELRVRRRTTVAAVLEEDRAR